MTHGRKRRAALWGVSLMSLLLTGATGPVSLSQTPGEPTPESAVISNVITVSPSTTIRGSSFEVSVLNAPPRAAHVVVELDGRPIPSQMMDPKVPGHIMASIPETTDAGSPAFIPLGVHHVSVMFDARWFTGGTTLTVVRPDQGRPLLRQISPAEILGAQARRRIVLTGSGFLTQTPDDNQIMMGGLPLAVVWDGCDHPQTWAKEKQHVAHGQVDPNGTTITLCNFRAPGGVAPEIGVRQGSVETTPFLTMHVPPLSKARIVWSSILVNLVTAALVVVLASLVRKYRIGNSHYGTFRILFLDPETNTYSLSKYQFYMWTGAAVFTYTYLAMSRIFVQEQSLPDIPSTLPGIIGIGAGTAIGSQLVTSVRGPKGGGQEKPSLGDFVTSGGVAAPDRVQMFVWTTLGVVGFCLATLRADPWNITGLPAVGTGLMYLMGLSSLGYLGGKLARKPGPVLNEISISAGPDALSTTKRPDSPLTVVLSAPLSAAQRVISEAQMALRNTSTADSPVAFVAAGEALKALQSSVNAAAQPHNRDLLSVMEANSIAADAAARTAANEYSRLAEQSGAGTEESRRFAEIAQECAAAAQDFASGSAQSIGVVQAASADPPTPTATAKAISLRGRNLSVDATFEINKMELPFRMLAPINGLRRPQIAAPEEDPNQPTLARELRLAIEPATLEQSDRVSFDSWFAGTATSLEFTITNPDGQRSDITFKVPPGSSQANG